MKKYLFTGLLLLFISSILFSGCGALIALVSSIFGSQGGFIFIPFLGDEKIAGSQTGKLPGMIMLYTNNPPANYKPLSGATVTITGITGNTNSDGSFYITGIPVGIGNLTVEHPSYTSITQDVPIPDPNATGTTFTNLRITPENHLMTIGIGGIFQYSSYATSSNNSIITPPTTWSVTGDIGTIGVNSGIFTATKAGTGYIKAVSGGLTAQVPVTVIAGTGTVYGKVTYNDNPVANATVYVEGFKEYVLTDGSGYYNLPGVPATHIKIIGYVDYDTQSNTFITPLAGKIETSGRTKLVGTNTLDLGTNETKEANVVLLDAGNLTPSEGTPTQFPTQGNHTPTPTPTTTAMVPVINSVSPKPGTAGSTAVIGVSNMDPSATTSNTTVTMGGTSATIQSMNSNSITVTIPSRSGESPVIVTVKGVASLPYAYWINLVDPNTPVITNVLNEAMEVHIIGQKFGPSAPLPAVTYNGVSAPVHSCLNGTDIWTDYPGIGGNVQVIVTTGGLSSAPYTHTLP